MDGIGIRREKQEDGGNEYLKRISARSFKLIWLWYKIEGSINGIITLWFRLDVSTIILENGLKWWISEEIGTLQWGIEISVKIWIWSEDKGNWIEKSNGIK